MVCDGLWRKKKKEKSRDRGSNPRRAVSKLGLNIWFQGGDWLLSDGQAGEKKKKSPQRKTTHKHKATRAKQTHQAKPQGTHQQPQANTSK